jgi:peptide/nickel transport system ATP-binding protein
MGQCLHMTAAKDEPVLSVRDLTVTFTGAGRPALAVRGISFDVYPGEVLGIVGESGSGKSVACLAIAGLLPDDAQVTGSIRLAGTEVLSADAETLRTLRGRDVGFVFQDPTTTLNPVLPVGRQIVEGQVALGRIAAGNARSRAVDALREVEIAAPQTRVAQYPHQFSGGMRQRAVIAMAMSGQPKLIIADEPTTALDVTVQAQVLALLARRQAATGAAAILVTHDLGVVAEVARRVAVMYGGRIIETASVRDIFERPRHPYTAALLKSAPRLDAGGSRLDPIPGQPPTPSALPTGCAFHPRCALAAGRSRCASDDPVLRSIESGRTVACHFAEEQAVPSVVFAEARAQAPRAAIERAPLLAIENLQVHFPIHSKVLRRTIGAVRAVDGVSLTLSAGETLGLVGESGCGKTTVSRAVMGLVPVTGGRIAFDGQTISGLSREQLRPFRRQMQYVFQDPFASLNPVRSVGDLVGEPLRIHGLYEEMGGDAWIRRLFEMVGLSPSVAGRLPREFSGGQKQRIGIARALALKPRLLILDEPVASLDVSIQAQVINLLQDLQQELGLAYLFVAHDLSVVKHTSDRVAVMYLGRIVEEGDKSAIYDTPMHPYTQALLSAVPRHDVRNGGGRLILQGEIPSPANPPGGCRFHPRCFRASARCAIDTPVLEPHPGIASRRACHHAGPYVTAPAAMATVYD